MPLLKRVNNSSSSSLIKKTLPQKMEQKKTPFLFISSSSTAIQLPPQGINPPLQKGESIPVAAGVISVPPPIYHCGYNEGKQIGDSHMKEEKEEEGYWYNGPTAVKQ